MENNLALFAGACLLGAALLVGIWHNFGMGRGKRVSTAEVIDLSKLKVKNGKGIARSFGNRATLVQFSTEFCGQCPGVRKQLQELEKKTPGLLHLDVDITDRLDLAAHFSVTQTPTVFILDPKGTIKFRISGTPRPGVIKAELQKLGAL